MLKVFRFLFPTHTETMPMSVLLLVLRVLFGSLLFVHGVQKLLSFGALSGVFPDPFGLSNPVSLSLVIFAELFCSVAFVSGFMFRLTPLPMIFSMGVALFGIHAADPFAMKELAFVYFAMFVLLYITGPGRYSLDHFIGFGLRSAALSAVPPTAVPPSAVPPTAVTTVPENPAPVVS